MTTMPYPPLVQGMGMQIPTEIGNISRNTDSYETDQTIVDVLTLKTHLQSHSPPKLDPHNYFKGNNVTSC